MRPLELPNPLPINIKGYCSGDNKASSVLDRRFNQCNHPVEAAYYFSYNEDGTPPEDIYLCIHCISDNHDTNHTKIRARFEVPYSYFDEIPSHKAFEIIIVDAILAERDLKVSKEIKKLRLQFWR